MDGDCDKVCTKFGPPGSVPINGGTAGQGLCARRTGRLWNDGDDYIYGTWYKGSEECRYHEPYQGEVTGEKIAYAGDYYCGCTSPKWKYTWGGKACATGAQAASHIRVLGMGDNTRANNFGICRFRKYRSSTGPYVMGIVDVNELCYTRLVPYGPDGEMGHGLSGYGDRDWKMQALCATPTGKAKARVCVRPLANPYTSMFKHCLLDLGGVAFGYYTKDESGMMFEDLNNIASVMKCADVKKASVHKLRAALVKLFDASDDFFWDQYNFCVKNCCTFVNTILENAGSKKVDEYIDGIVTGPCNWK